MRLTRQCFGCKQEFRKNELIAYTTLSGKTTNWYCPECLSQKKSREAFSDKICEIFQIKAPGPIIWTQRKRLYEKYGYTDETILNCLEYVYNVENKKILSETLHLVTPSMVEKAEKYRRYKQYESNTIASSVLNQQTIEHVVRAHENQDAGTNEWNPDDFLNDE